MTYIQTQLIVRGIQGVLRNSTTQTYLLHLVRCTIFVDKNATSISML